jgi:Ca2+-binding EF-hand superfamily protein
MLMVFAELDVVLKRLGVRMSKKELDDMLSIVDTDGSGTIEFAEFLQMVCTSDTPDMDPEEELYET